MANGIMEVLPNRPFRIWLSNFGHNPVWLPKSAIVGLALNAPSGIYTVNGDMMAALESEPPEAPQSKEGGADGEAPSESVSEEQEWKQQIDMGVEDPATRERILDMLGEFEEMWNGRLGRIDAAKHRIQLTPEARPVFQAPYRAGQKAREFVKEEVTRMLRDGVIEPSASEWASPIVLAEKKDGSLRFCVDYRKLNAVTVRDSYPIPRMDECIDSLGDATVFTTLDANSGYWQIPIAEEDRDKTTFVCHSGLFRFLRMPFGLKNAPATFQRAIDIILSRVKWEFALVYLDDVIIYSKTVTEHIIHVRQVLGMLRAAGVSLKLRKCAFFKPSVDYLGHVIRPGKLEVASKMTDALKKALPPTNQTELRSFIGMCNVYRRFIKNFARIAAPLNRKLEKNQPFTFGTITGTDYEAFQELKTKLISPPILALPRHGYKYTLDTDACVYQVGCTLLQEQPNGDKLPVGYWSRSLTKAEKNYSATERECLAIVWGILTLRPYLEGVRFTVRTDHNPLKWILNIADTANGRLMRWRLRLAEFDYDVEYRPGVKHNLADGMSRLRTEGGDETPLRDDVPTYTICLVKSPNGEVEDIREGEWEEVDDIFENKNRPGMPEVTAFAVEEKEVMPVTVEELIAEQAKDEYCRSVAESVGKRSSSFAYDRNGVLVRKSRLDGTLQKVVPESLRARILYLSHYPRLAGHPGGTRMYYTMRRDFYWPLMANDVHATVRDCESCAKTRGTQYKHQRKMKMFPASGPLEFVAMDILGPLPKTDGGNRFVLVITDRFTKMCRAIPIRSTRSHTIARVFLENWVYPYGAPTHLLSDNGPQFASKFFAAVNYMLGVKHYLTTAYHPQSNGQTERFNKTLVQRLRHYVEEHQANWDIFVQPLTYAYNMQVHRSTGTTPYDLVLTRHPQPITVRDEESRTAIPQSEPDDPTPAQMKRIILRRLRVALQSARIRMTEAQKRYKQNFDKSVRFTPQFKAGDYVYIDRPPRQPDAAPEEEVTKKLLPRGLGPYKIQSVSENTVTVDEDGLLNTVSIDRVTLAPRSRTGNAPVTTERTFDIFKNPYPSGEFEIPELDEEPFVEFGIPGLENYETPHGDYGEYPIEEIVGHRETPNGVEFRVRWYGYPAAYDEFLPSSDIPQNFITRYWRKSSGRA